MSWLGSKKKDIVVFAIVLVYMVLNMFLTLKEFYFLNLLPVIVLIAYLALSRLDIVYFIVVFLTPLSIPLIHINPSSPIDFYIPTEPILFGVLIIMVYKMLREGILDRKLLNHPVTYAILFNLVWLLITSITSSMPVVSFKFLLARLWFLSAFYFLAVFVFRKTSNIPLLAWCYGIPLMGVVIFAISRHLSYGLFDKMAAHLVMYPFYRDHTSYGAILAMMFFAVGGVVIQRGSNFVLRFIYWVGFAILVSGLILSYTRAAWISVLGSFIILALTLLKVKFKYVALFVILVGAFLFSQRLEIQHKLEQNRQDSSADLAEHVQSISNITTDDSNLERMNRWSSALRMFEERPVFGWGPGTYMFNYAPYQLSSNKTLISTDFGDKGNAHSEYIGPLSESGVLGSLSFIFIIITATVTGFRAYRKADDPQVKRIVLAYLLAFFTYVMHGVLNNFLDTDKASALFWGFIAVFVSVDIYYQPRNSSLEAQEIAEESIPLTGQNQ
ncbi:MAG: O-antigen ligase family protein [Bacteroidales bacterium]|nr:O-antigen ligase family protein [Bacteroidales bacterium]